ncbi:SOS response-associated peptidase [Falsarthrobacter nasiphocae]|uniref:Abasic site processing protein n=1 Tax=Falsarthrobacter nasiphocae TaxID=189863 RepID=A0AAE3YG72_9MICC|nr:SOS response-associated peptidase [Falsarthrobacter nasiphocae]MDR6891181.1 putative SOS response-associated peptidase YedK [Falsarthrobacter nasiphocae]
MCGRYVVARSTGDLMAEFDLQAGGDVDVRESYNVAPTTPVPIVVRRPGEDGEGPGPRELAVARWGLVPPWAKDLNFSSRAFNARSETVREKPTFRSAVKRKRCLVLASGYYEWLAPETPSGKKRPFFIHPEDGSTIAFAGLYEWWRDPAGGEESPWVLSCTILTMASPDQDEPGVLGELGRLHDRLPVPLDPAFFDEWLDPENDDAELLVDTATAAAFDVASGWTMHEVGPAVGNVRNNGPELTEPVGEQGSLFSA